MVVVIPSIQLHVLRALQPAAQLPQHMGKYGIKLKTGILKNS